MLDEEYSEDQEKWARAVAVGGRLEWLVAGEAAVGSVFGQLAYFEASLGLALGSIQVAVDTYLDWQPHQDWHEKVVL